MILRRLRHLVIFLLPILLCPSVRSAETEKPSPSAFKTAVLAELRGKKFIRNPSNCKVFADLILTDAGLPRIGQDAPVLGQREDLNRTRELENLPVLEDSTLRSEHPYAEYRVKTYAHPTAKDVWYLELTRNREIAKGSKTELKTLFTFWIGSAANRPSCDLTEIHFQEPSEKLSGSYDSERCLGLFDPATTASGEETAAQSAIQQDCALGLRYFLSMKWPR